MSDFVKISSDAAHLWVAEPSELGKTGCLSGYLQILSASELEQMHRFCFEQDRLAFLAAHGLLRTALSSCVPSVPPEVWEFGSGEQGKPEITWPAVTPMLRFNITHTRRLVACVVNVEIECGVDAETLDHVTDITGLARKVLSPAEYAKLLAVPTNAQPELFFAYWTLKEAYVKALGRGISIPFDNLTFDIRPEGITATLDPSLNDDGANWQFAQWSPTKKHLLAVALHRGRQDNYRIVRHDLPAQINHRLYSALPP